MQLFGVHDFFVNPSMGRCILFQIQLLSWQPFASNSRQQGFFANLIIFQNQLCLLNILIIINQCNCVNIFLHCCRLSLWLLQINWRRKSIASKSLATLTRLSVFFCRGKKDFDSGADRVGLPLLCLVCWRNSIVQSQECPSQNLFTKENIKSAFETFQVNIKFYRRRPQKGWYEL